MSLLGRIAQKTFELNEELEALEEDIADDIPGAQEEQDKIIELRDKLYREHFDLRNETDHYYQLEQDIKKRNI